MFESTRIFLELILFSKVAYWLAISGYSAFKNKEKLAYSDERESLAKKFAGLDKLFYSALLWAVIVVYIKTLLEMGAEKIQKILFLANPNPVFGLSMVVIAMILFFYQMSRANSQPENIAINESSYKSFKLIMTYFLIIGIEFTFGFPYWVFIGTFAYIIYFSPLVSELNKSELFKRSYSKKT